MAARFREIPQLDWDPLEHTTLDPETGCRRWTKAVNDAGYGVLCIGKKTYKAHRVSYVQTYGPIPQDRPHIDHVRDRGCRHRDCIEPSHLEAVTQAENNRRAFAGQESCCNGHSNYRRDASGRKYCATCVSEYQKRRYAAKRAGQPDRSNSTKTHCPQGHPYSGDNLYSFIRPNGRPGRACRTCRSDASRRSKGKEQA